MPRITWRAGAHSGTAEAEAGSPLMDALRALGLSFPCGGRHTCGKCRVLASGALSEAGENERALLRGTPAGTRLACFVRVLGDCEIILPQRAGDRIETGSAVLDAPLDPIYKGAFGAAFDIGTTTVVGYLFSREKPEALAVAGEMNRQGRCGADVLSRIEFTLQNTVEPLRELICGQLSDLLVRLCRDAGIGKDQLSGLCVTGNTTMLHMAAGLDPRSLSQAPFTPQTLFGETWDLRLPDFPDLPAYLPRCVSAYVGADITCSILASGILRQPGRWLLVDVGTNGEMALKTGEGLFCCATAAGPAFEGAGISCGSSACAGAISQVSLEDGALRCAVLDGGEAKTLCGSGLIDAVACLLRRGDITPKGRTGGALPLFGAVQLTQMDVRQLQLAKGAVRGGMDTLLHAAGLSYGQLDGIVLCGGFGSRLDPASAEAIGLLPAGMAEKTSAIGNAAGAGAGRILQSRPCLDEAARIPAMAHVVELSASKYFQKRYIQAMNFPPLCEQDPLSNLGGRQL